MDRTRVGVRTAGFLLLALVAPLLVACGAQAPSAPAATAAPVVQTVVVAGTPQTVVVTATPAPPTPAPSAQLRDTIIVGTWQEPRSFLDYANSQAIRVEVELVYRPRWVQLRDFGYQANPALVEGELPSFDNGGAAFSEVTVKAGEPIFDLETKTVVPAKADTSAKQLTVTATIKGGLKWDDGAPLTAADFVYGWKLSCDADSGTLSLSNCPFGSSEAAGGFVADYQAKDDTTLVLTYAPGVIDPVYYLTVFGPNGNPQPQHLFGDTSPADLQKDERATGGTSAVPLGYGPYKMTKWVKGESVTFEANPNWSGTAAKTPKLVYKFFADAVALASAVIAGDIDSSSGQTGVDIDQYPYLTSVAKNGDINFEILNDNARFEFLTLNLNDPNDPTLKKPHPLLGDANVRKAFALALNRQQMIDTIFFGQSKLVDQPQLPQMSSYDLALGKLEYNLDEAKKLMDTAGWVPGADGIREKGGQRASLTIVTTSGVPLRQKATQIMQSNLAEIGIEANLSYVPSAVLISNDVYYTRRFDVILLANTFSSVDPGNWWYTSAACDQIPTPDNNFAGSNYAGWCDKAASDASVTANFVTLDPQERKAAWDTVLKRYFDDGYPLVPLFIRPTMLATVPGLSGPKLNGTEYFTWNVETWALAE